MTILNLYVQLASSFFMAGLIAMVQWVHYPSFRYVAPELFVEFSQFHQKMITWIVMPVMLIELASAVALVFQLPSHRGLLLGNLILLAGVWASTFFLSVPLHEKLLLGFSDETITRLVQTNWPRTLLWFAKSGLLFYFLLNVKDLSRI